MKICALLIDDHAVLRAGLASLLEQAGLQVRAQAGSVVEGLRLARQESPDLVVCDMDLPDGSGLELTARLRELLPKATLIGLTGMPLQPLREPLKEAGSDALLSKNLSAEELQRAIVDALPGGNERLQKDAQEDGADLLSLRFPQLTGRELDVTHWVGQGKTNHEIAQILDIRHSTVKVHLRNVFTKLHLENRMQLIRLVMENRT